MRAAAFAQQRLHDLHVVVAGADRIAYSYASKHESGSWKQQLLEELNGRLDLTRLHFPGLINYRSFDDCFIVQPTLLFYAALCN